MPSTRASAAANKKGLRLITRAAPTFIFPLQLKSAACHTDRRAYSICLRNRRTAPQTSKTTGTATIAVR